MTENDFVLKRFLLHWHVAATHYPDCEFCLTGFVTPTPFRNLEPPKKNITLKEMSNSEWTAHEAELLGEEIARSTHPTNLPHSQSAMEPTFDAKTVEERTRALIEWRISMAMRKLYPDDCFNASTHLRAPFAEDSFSLGPPITGLGRQYSADIALQHEIDNVLSRELSLLNQQIAAEQHAAELAHIEAMALEVECDRLLELCGVVGSKTVELQRLNAQARQIRSAEHEHPPHPITVFDSPSEPSQKSALEGRSRDVGELLKQEGKVALHMQTLRVSDEMRRGESSNASTPTSQKINDSRLRSKRTIDDLSLELKKASFQRLLAEASSERGTQLEAHEAPSHFISTRFHDLSELVSQLAVGRAAIGLEQRASEKAERHAQRLINIEKKSSEQTSALSSAKKKLELIARQECVQNNELENFALGHMGETFPRTKSNIEDVWPLH